VCYKSNLTPTWTNPTNPIIAPATDAGLQRTFHIGFEATSGDPAIGVYSDNTAIPKLKKYIASTSTWDLTATSLSALGATLKTVRIIPVQNTDDMMILFGDGNLDLFSMMWDGTNNVVYPNLIGNSSIETSVDSNAVGTAEAFQVTANASDSVSSIQLYLDATSASTNMTVGLYANASGHPGTLLTQGSSTALTNGAWNSISVPAVSVIQGTSYWIAILGTQSGVPRFRDRNPGSCSSETSSQTTLTALPATWTTGTVFSTCPLSAYAATSGSAFTAHGINGSAAAEYWYDFTWDGN
jgi:hypothetical protein